MKHAITRILALTTLSLALVSCATEQPTQPTASAAATPETQPAKVLSWPDRYSQLTDITSWNIQGSVSIKHQNRTDLASLSWDQQRSSRYAITLSGPLSIGRVAISGQPGLVTLQRSGQPTQTAKSAETLMQQQLGWQIPVSNLYYWVRGIAAPGATADFKFDKANHIVGMAQNGWNIQYLGFTQVNNVDLPQKIILYNPNMQATLVIKQWSVRPSTQVAMAGQPGAR